MMRRASAFLMVAMVAMVATSITTSNVEAGPLRIRRDEDAGTIAVYRRDGKEPILTQNARANFRPYLHPIVAPDGKGVLTEYSPGHHKHQTGLYWGFTRVNGRDYFHHPEGTHWRRVSSSVLQGDGDGKYETVAWRTVYDLLDADGEAVLTETQTWSMREVDGEYILDLEWIGEGRTDVTIGKYDYGGLFLRMPWRRGMEGTVFNTSRQKNRRAEGQRAPWVDVGMKVDGRDDFAHIAIFDHSSNAGFPQPWRVDGQLGVGPVRARLGDWSIAKGKRAVIRHQLRVYTGELNDTELTKKWQKYSGQRGTYALWGLAQREGRAAKFLTAEKAVAQMTLRDGFEVNAYASEPMMTQPMAFCWDDRGRLWIAENRDYESRGRGFSNFGDSRILILEDTDHDGVADTRKVFLEGIPFPAGIAVGFDGLWLGAPPTLLFVPDRDGDDVADMDDIEVRLTGWGIRDRHETLNSFHWGPDGWLYGCQGYATPSKVGKPKGKGKVYKHREPFPRKTEFEGEPVDINGGVWRYHPTKKIFEVVAHGFSNPWGIDYDAKGQLFISACVIPHLWHVIPGGIYHRQGGRHFSPYVYSDIRTITDHRHRSAHGGARVYQSDAFPDEYSGRIFMANIHEHAVLTDILERKGSGFVGHHGDDLLLANNAQWIGFSVEIGPDGAVYVLDWHDADICGKDVLNKDTGRIYRITSKSSKARQWDGRYSDVSKMSDEALVRLQLSESDWHARRARVVLQNRALKNRLDKGTHGLLRQILVSHDNPDWRLRAMWALHVTGGFTAPDLVKTLGDADEHVRAWSIQFLCEDSSPPDGVLEKLASMARKDDSPVVRLYLAAALQRVDAAKRWPLANALAGRAEDADDHNIPKMIWFGIEKLVPQDPTRSLELASKSKIPLVTRHIARRLADADKLETLIAAIGKPSDARLQLIRGTRDALDGRFDVTAPPSWETTYASLQKSGVDEIAQLAVELAQRLGDNAAARKRLATLTDRDAKVDDRRSALRALARQRFPELRSRIFALLDEPALRRDAIRAMASIDHDQVATTLLGRYADLSNEEKLEVVHTLASRPRSGRKLAQAIRKGEVPRRDVPAYVARQLRRVVGSGFVEIWGPVEARSSETEAAFTKYRALLTEETLANANPSKGRLVFERTCAPCHKLYGNGGEIAPELTGANRTDLNYVLGNILAPSDVIQDDYRMLLVLTNEGRLYSGILANENPRQIQLRVAGEPEPVLIAKSSIASRETAKVSLMPEGILRNLTDTEVLDLVAYLRTPAQVPLPAATSAGKK
jgi:putative membrane-bound dehydrogenase-like protein